MEYCENLNEYGVQVRYPFHKFDLEESDVNEALKYKDIIKKFVNEKLDVLNGAVSR